MKTFKVKIIETNVMLASVHAKNAEHAKYKALSEVNEP